MGRKRGVIYVSGNAYCHCPDIDCGDTHAVHDGIPNDDAAAFQLVFSGGGDELYRDVDDAMADLLGAGITNFTPFEPGDAQIVNLDSGEVWDAAEFRDAHL